VFRGSGCRRNDGEPSSVQTLSLSDRTGAFSDCHAIGDRDILAANNIKRFSFVKQNISGGTGDESGEMPVNKRGRRTRKLQE
jgi:hypothetical protein